MQNCVNSLYSQEEEIIQLTGIITNIDEELLPFVHTINKNRLTGSYSDIRGIYSIIVEKSDTIIYTCIGYKPQIFIIPDSISDVHFTADIKMIKDTISIDEIIVLPWKTYEEFQKAFIELELPEDDAERARKNIALIKTQMLTSNTSTPNSSFRQVMQQEYENTFVQGQFPTFKIFDAVSWAKFIKALQDGDFKKKE